MTAQKKTYLIDTSFLLAYQNKDDKKLMDDCRETVCLLKKEEYPRFITTEMIYCEYSSYIWGKLANNNKKLAIEKICEISENFEIEFIDSNIFKLAYQLFLEKNVKGYHWSFVDCTSFVFIQERRKKKYADQRIDIKYALAMDGHFDDAQREFGFSVFTL